MLLEWGLLVRISVLRALPHRKGSVSAGSVGASERGGGRSAGINSRSTLRARTPGLSVLGYRLLVAETPKHLTAQPSAIKGHSASPPLVNNATARTTARVL